MAPPPRRKTTTKKCFEGLSIVLNGKLSQTQSALEQLVEENGGNILKSSEAISASVVVSAESEKALASNVVQKVVDAGIPVVSEAWMHECIESKSLKPFSDFSCFPASQSVSPPSPAPKPSSDSASKRGRKKRSSDDASSTKDDVKDVASNAAPTSDNGPKVDKKRKKTNTDTNNVLADSKSSSSSSIVDPITTTLSSESIKYVKKGKIPVDPFCGLASTHHVYEDSDGVYSCMLNQTDISRNNNKFYVIQVLKADSSQSYICFTRWGRVGEKGMMQKFGPFSDSVSAILQFCGKFHDKTKNDWSSRNSFIKYSGKYDLVENDWEANDSSGAGDESSTKVKDEDKDATTESDEPKQIESKLPVELQDFLSLICDMSMFERSMKAFDIDPKKCPLGKLSKRQIERGFHVVKEIDDILRSSSLSASDQRSRLVDLSSQFYTIIPHDYPRSVVPPIINTLDAVKIKVRMLEMLGEMEIASRLLQDSAKQIDKHPIDAAYENLHCELVPLSHDSEEYKMLCEYVWNTHADTHRMYELEVLDIFEIRREGEEDRFKRWESLHNRRLLWHGSRLANWCGIFSKGLLIAPPEAPATGYMFGKGIYFADSVSKSANYCRTTRRDNIGVLALCEVALGDMYECSSAQYMEKPPKGYHSTWGMGGTAPTSDEGYITSDGLYIPKGSLKDTGASSSLLYNEFIIYDTTQTKMKYVLKTRFVYK